MLTDVIGRRETGKTTLSLYLAYLIEQRVLWDPRNGIAAGAGALKVTSASEFRHAAMPALVARDVSTVIYSPQSDDLDAAFLLFGSQVKRWVLADPSRPLAVLIDESFLVKDALDRGKHPIKSAMRWCARDRVHFFLTCHRPVEVPLGVRAISDYWLLFQCHQEEDLDLIAKRCGPAVATRALALKPHEFIIWDDTKAVVRPSALKPPDWYLDLAQPAAPAPAALVGPFPVDSGSLWT